VATHRVTANDKMTINSYHREWQRKFLKGNNVRNYLCLSAIIGKVQRNLGLTNLKGPNILFFIAGTLLLQGLFNIK
jgi:Neuraminidase (sialidase)